MSVEKGLLQADAIHGVLSAIALPNWITSPTYAKDILVQITQLQLSASPRTYSVVPMTGFLTSYNCISHIIHNTPK